MLTIHVAENLEHFVKSAVSTGRYATEDDVVSDALIRLRREIAESLDTSDQTTGPGEPAKKLTKQEFRRHLVEIGLLDEPAENIPLAGDSARLIDEQGEVVDEMVIRERLIEWLTGFLK